MDPPRAPAPDLMPRLAALLEREQGYAAARVTRGTRLSDDVGMDGDDAVEFFEAYAWDLGVDMADFRFYHHFGPEGCNPWWLLVRPWWARVAHLSLTVGDLEDAARGPVDVSVPAGPALPPAGVTGECHRGAFRPAAP